MENSTAFARKEKYEERSITDFASRFFIPRIESIMLRPALSKSMPENQWSFRKGGAAAVFRKPPAHVLSHIPYAHIAYTFSSDTRERAPPPSPLLFFIQIFIDDNFHGTFSGILTVLFMCVCVQGRMGELKEGCLHPVKTKALFYLLTGKRSQF